MNVCEAVSVIQGAQHVLKNGGSDYPATDAF